MVPRLRRLLRPASIVLVASVLVYLIDPLAAHAWYTAALAAILLASVWALAGDQRQATARLRASQKEAASAVARAEDARLEDRALLAELAAYARQLEKSRIKADSHTQSLIRAVQQLVSAQGKALGGQLEVHARQLEKSRIKADNHTQRLVRDLQQSLVERGAGVSTKLENMERSRVRSDRTLLERVTRTQIHSGQQLAATERRLDDLASSVHLLSNLLTSHLVATELKMDRATVESQTAGDLGNRVSQPL